MSEAEHHDPSKNWLIFFFVCFTLTVGAIGFWAFLSYHVDDGAAPQPEGHHGMIAPGADPHSTSLSIG